MKRALSLCFIVFMCSNVLYAQKSSKAKTKSKPSTSRDVVNTNEINWISLDDVQIKMKKAPKKVYMDIYTDWCGWCKVMDKKTFTNPNVIKYINQNYYAVKLNAEQKDSIYFMGGRYGLEGRTNQFAIQLLRGQMSYPSTVILEENFQSPQVIPGYLEVSQIESLLKYFAENKHKSTPWEEYLKNFKGSW